MGNFRYKMAQFMIGRNGFDHFSRALVFMSMALILADIIIPGRILRTIGIFLMIYSYYRAFSRNIPRRSGENQWFITCVMMPLNAYSKRDRKNYKYFKCPSCKQVLRAPKGRGKIRVTCSRCHNIFEKKV